MIKVLVVEDSPVVREFLVHILNSDPDITVIATANDGEEALGVVRRQRPDVITMDIHMPKLNGLEATRLIMETSPTPIVIVSGSENPSKVITTFNAMDAGALAVLRRPAGIGHPDHGATAQDMIQTVKLMSDVRGRTAGSAPSKRGRGPRTGGNKTCRHGCLDRRPTSARSYPGDASKKFLRAYFDRPAHVRRVHKRIR